MGGRCHNDNLVFTHNVEPRVHERPERDKCKLANNIGCTARGRGLCLDKLRGHVELVARLALVKVVRNLVLVAGPEARTEVPYDGQ